MSMPSLPQPAESFPDQKITVSAFYQFADLADYRDLQLRLKAICADHGIKGTILLAAEGINGTIAGLAVGINSCLDYLRQDPRCQGLMDKRAYCDQMPFQRLKVRLKKEIITIGAGKIPPNAPVGQYVSPQEWNDLLQDPEVLVLDTRNDYEVALGTFQQAVNPNLTAFGEFPDYVQKNLDPQKHSKVAMFCTGGIRCEKASAYMLSQGFSEVYHLHGGILKYLEEVPPEQTLWQGKCFVFDERVGVDHHSYGYGSESSSNRDL